MIKSNLRVVLAQKNMTRYELAKLAGIRPAAVSEIIGIGESEREMRRVPIKTLDDICRVLQCDLSDVLYYVPDPDEKSLEI